MTVTNQYGEAINWDDEVGQKLIERQLAKAKHDYQVKHWEQKFPEPSGPAPDHVLEYTLKEMVRQLQRNGVSIYDFVNATIEMLKNNRVDIDGREQVAFDRIFDDLETLGRELTTVELRSREFARQEMKAHLQPMDEKLILLVTQMAETQAKLEATIAAQNERIELLQIEYGRF